MHHISSFPVYVSAGKLAKMHGIAPSTALKIDKEVLRSQLPPPKLDGIEAIPVDEKYMGLSYGFVTLVINDRTGEPLHMSEGKDGAALESFFNLLTDKPKRSILYLGIDRANAYRAAAVKHLPWVKVCYEAYHLVSDMNEGVDKVRRVEMQHPTEAPRRRLAGKRYNLLRAKENLDADAKREPEELPAFNQKLNTTYVLKERFRTVFSPDSENGDFCN